MYLYEELKSKIAAMIKEASGEEVSSDVLEYPADHANGDLAFPCFMLARTLKQAPPKIAAEMAAKLGSDPMIARIEAKGPYLNFFLADETLFDKAPAEAVSVGEAFGLRKGEKTERVMVEYVSPNNNKPLHLGHVRNGLIGATLSNLLETQGHEVIRALLLNDRGLAIAKAMVAYARWGDLKTPASAGAKGDHLVAEFYVMYDKKAKEDATLETEAHDVIRKWEEGDEATRKLWKMLNDWCEKGQHETYKKLGFRFDIEYKESDIYKGGKDLIEEGLKKGVFTKDESGAVVAKLEAHGLPDKVVLRADGTSLYITQDLELARKKVEESALDRSIYVVGNEQNLQLRQLFKILELLGFAWAKKMTHLSYGYVTLPEGRMKSREGTVVDADDLVAALETDAAIEIKQRHDGITDDELVRRARMVALAALKFHFLEIDIASDTVYDPKASLSFTGRTGPYLQYMHARVKSILRKAADAKTEGEGRLITPEEHVLALAVMRYPEMVRQSAETMRPSLVANHLYETAKAFSAFYEKSPVLNTSMENRAARLNLATAAAVVLKNGLGLLGIEAPEEM